MQVGNFNVSSFVYKNLVKQEMLEQITFLNWALLFTFSYGVFLFDRWEVLPFQSLVFHKWRHKSNPFISTCLCKIDTKSLNPGAWCPGTNFTYVLRAAFMCPDLKSRKNTVKSSVFFVILQSVREKAAGRMLMKLTPGCTI